MPCRRYTRSSVAILPVALGAKGQPPVPPTEASSTVAPDSTAAAALAMPVLRVSWKWQPTVVVFGRVWGVGGRGQPRVGPNAGPPPPPPRTPWGPPPRWVWASTFSPGP